MLKKNPLVNCDRTLSSWREIIEFEDSFDGPYMFRGQGGDWELKSSLHRTCDRFQICYQNAFELEYALRRDFRRSYNGQDQKRVEDEAMYCLAKMQHYGAPTRMIDWTYSFFIALFFAIEKASVGVPVYIWTFNYDWVKKYLAKCGKEQHWKARNVDETISDSSLVEDEYFTEKNSYVYTEGALGLNTRLSEQQGLFVLPGVLNKTVDEILSETLDEPNVISRVTVKLEKSEFSKLISKFNRMRLTHKTIYPDSPSLGEELIMKIPALSIRLGRIKSGEFNKIEKQNKQG